ncbi:hypothetical protein [Bacillus cereus]|uniref:hypothetical protein n=1 Tax=Bacillus cereus TaxID=1396 RepID=UPI000B49AA19|nr:hypothetical protein [Bacillus cereus]
MYIEHGAVVKEIEDYTKKPNVLGTLKGYPYSDLEDRQFEVLVYSLFKEEIERGNLKQFDSINLMQGVGERGRDCSLHYQGKNVGLIQCKKYQNRLNKPETAKEIIKFCLYYLQDNDLITDIHRFEYYIAVSNDFSGTAIELIEDFNKKIIVEENLKKWTEDVIKNYSSFNGMKYNTIKPSLLEVLGNIKVKKITANNLNLLLEKYGYIQNFFFSLKTVISVEDNRKMIKEVLQEITDENMVNTVMVNKFNSREEVKKILHSLLKRNEAIFNEYGPHGRHKEELFTDAPLMWEKLCIEEIVPNNKKIAELLIINEDLLLEQEEKVVGKFLLHQKGFECMVISGERNASIPLFPTEIKDILS